MSIKGLVLSDNCRIKIVYEGRGSKIYLMKRSDSISDTGLAVGNQTVGSNPRSIITSLNAGTYIFVVIHNDSFTDSQGYNLTIWTDDTNNGCPNFCRDKENALRNVYNEVNKCECKKDY